MPTPHYYNINGIDPWDILKHLTPAGANAAKYIIRSCRTDGHTKGNKTNDLHKAIDYLQRELADTHDDQ